MMKIRFRLRFRSRSYNTSNVIRRYFVGDAAKRPVGRCQCGRVPKCDFVGDVATIEILDNVRSYVGS